MNNPDFTDQSFPSSVLSTEQSRLRVVRAALNITQNTTIAPSPYELKLLDQFVLGELTIDEVLALLEETPSC